MNTIGSSISRRDLLAGAATAGLIAMASPVMRAGAQEGGAGALAGRDLLLDKRPIIHAGGSTFGAYDPYGDFTNDRNVATEHLFLPWEDVDLGTLGAVDEYAASRGRKILITIEPWSWALDWNVSSSELRERILAGRHDDNMRAILDAVKGFRSALTIRWAQEMESTTGRFTWQGWQPEDYIRAFRRMSDLTRRTLPSARVMWSPKGEQNLGAFFPGDDAFDIVGLSVFGLEAFDEIEFKAPRFFEQALQQGYELTVGYNKPIWVAELGYEGDVAYLARWVDEVTRQYARYPALTEVIYFNDKEVWPWPYRLGLPNWRVARQQAIYPVRR